MKGRLGSRNRLVGLDIGTRSVKAAEVSRTRKGFSLRSVGAADLSMGIVQKGVIRQPRALKAALEHVFDQGCFGGTKVALALGGYHVFVKRIRFRLRPELDLDQTVMSEAEASIPYALNDVNIDYHIVGAAVEDRDYLEVFLVTARKEMVETLTTLLVEAGLTPCVIDLDAFALQNLLLLNQANEGGPVAVIDIGASKTVVNIFNGSEPLFVHHVPVGTRQIDDLSGLNRGPSCENTENRSVKASPPALNTAARDAAAGQWMTELESTVDFFQARYPGATINRWVLSGGGAHVRSFQHRLAVQTTIPVEIIDPFQRVSVDRRRFDTVAMASIAPQMAVALGLALREEHDT